MTNIDEWQGRLRALATEPERPYGGLFGGRDIGEHPDLPYRQHIPHDTYHVVDGDGQHWQIPAISKAHAVNVWADMQDPDSDKIEPDIENVFTDDEWNSLSPEQRRHPLARTPYFYNSGDTDISGSQYVQRGFGEGGRGPENGDDQQHSSPYYDPGGYLPSQDPRLIRGPVRQDRDIYGRPRDRESQAGHIKFPRGHRTTNISDALRYAVRTASSGGSDFDWRLHSTKGVANPNEYDTGRMPSPTASMFADAVRSGRMQHAIYHYQTPLAWKEKVSPDSDETRWVVPDERYSVTSNRRVDQIKRFIRGEGVSEIVEPYPTERGWPLSHLRMPPITGNGMSQHEMADALAARLGQHGYVRPSTNTHNKAFFLNENERGDRPWSTVRDGSYIRPAENRAGGPIWIAGKHVGGSNLATGSRSFRNLGDAIAHADYIRGIPESELGQEADRLPSWRADLRRRRGPGTNLPPRPAPVLPDQEEIPGIDTVSSVMSWSYGLRE